MNDASTPEDGPWPVLFVSMPYSGLGPLLVMAGELARRGVCDIWVATTEKNRPAVEALAAAAPVHFASMGDGIPEAGEALEDPEYYAALTQRDPWKATYSFIRRNADVDIHTEAYRLLDAHVARVKPALMVIDSASFFGVEVAMTRRIPYVLGVCFLPSNLFQLSLPAAYPEPYTGLPLRMTPAQRRQNTLFRMRMLSLPVRPAMLRGTLTYLKRRSALGIDPASALPKARIARAKAIIYYSVPGLDYPFPMTDAMHMLGAMVPPLPEAPGSETDRWLDAHESVVYLGFGTMAKIDARQVGTLVEVARQLGDQHQVLWKLPRQQQELLPPPDQRPTNLRIEQWLPSQFDVLAHPHVRAFFTHGGANSYHEGVHFGKPLLVWPLWLDCRDVARRVEDSGVGLSVEDLDPAHATEITAKLRRLIEEESFARRAGEFAATQQKAGGVRAAADLILTASGRPSAVRSRLQKEEPV